MHASANICQYTHTHTHPPHASFCRILIIPQSISISTPNTHNSPTTTARTHKSCALAASELGAIASHVVSHCSTIGEHGETVHIAVTTEETHQATVSGPQESHTIHAIRATTVIFEEDGDFDEPEADASSAATVANIILPNRPHQSALQVEEVASYQLESQLAVESAVDVQRGIVDELDSDCGSSSATATQSVRKSLYSRNVSIVSAASEDDSAAVGSSGRDVAVEEYQQTIDLADGQAHVRFTKTVIEEQQVIEVSEQNGDRHEPAPETNETNETTRQSRIKEIRAQARKASLASRESVEEVAVDSEVQYTRSDSAASQNNGTSANSNNARLFDQADAEDEEMAVEDAALAQLLQRGRAQRAALGEILNESAAALERQTSTGATSVLSESEDGTAPAGTRTFSTRESTLYTYI